MPIMQTKYNRTSPASLSCFWFCVLLVLHLSGVLLLDSSYPQHLVAFRSTSDHSHSFQNGLKDAGRILGLAGYSHCSPISLQKRSLVSEECFKCFKFFGLGLHRGCRCGIIVAERLIEQSLKVILLERGGPSYASTGGNATTSWNTNGLTPYDVSSQNSHVFEGGYSHTCPDVPGAAGCLLGGVRISECEVIREVEADGFVGRVNQRNGLCPPA
jgi:hypothetical protein